MMKKKQKTVERPESMKAVWCEWWLAGQDYRGWVMYTEWMAAEYHNKLRKLKAIEVLEQYTGGRLAENISNIVWCETIVVPYVIRLNTEIDWLIDWLIWEFGEKFANFNEFYNGYERTEQLWRKCRWPVTVNVLVYVDGLRLILDTDVKRRWRLGLVALHASTNLLCVKPD